MNDRQPMRCPVCGEDAMPHSHPAPLPPQPQPSQPEWSHPDGTSLCPVITPSGGCEPAQPQPPTGGPAVDTPRLAPPAGGSPGRWPGLASRLGTRGGARQLPAGTAGLTGRRHMTAVIGRLGNSRQPTHEPEPEAGG